MRLDGPCRMEEGAAVGTRRPTWAVLSFLEHLVVTTTSTISTRVRRGSPIGPAFGLARKAAAEFHLKSIDVTQENAHLSLPARRSRFAFRSLVFTFACAIRSLL